jgi:hypothetical protein
VARGDPTYLRLDIDKVLNGERINTLSGDRFKVYIILRALCLKYRSDVLPVQMSIPKSVEGKANLGQRRGKESIERILKALAEEPYNLIAICPHNGRIKVFELIEVNKALHWDRANGNCPHLGPCLGNHSFPKWGCVKGGESERLKDRDLSTDPDTEIVTQSEFSPGAPPADPRSRSKIEFTPENGIEPRLNIKQLLEQQDRIREAERAADPEDLEPWNQVDQESELEREVYRWFLELWPHNEYDWEAEKDSLLSQVRQSGLGRFNEAIMALRDKRRRFERIENELAFVCGTAKGIKNQPHKR